MINYLIHCCYIETQLALCINLVSYNHALITYLLVSEVLGDSPPRQDFLNKQSCNTQQGQFYVFLPNLHTFYFLFFPPYCINKGSSTLFKRTDEREHLCLVLELSEKALNFWPLSMTLTIGFCRWALSSWGYRSLILVYWEFFLPWVTIVHLLE